MAAAMEKNLREILAVSYRKLTVMSSHRGRVSLRVKLFVKGMIDKLEAIVAAQNDEEYDSDSSDDDIVSVLV